jgi:hypothetical protein
MYCTENVKTAHKGIYMVQLIRKSYPRTALEAGAGTVLVRLSAFGWRVVLAKVKPLARSIRQA